MIIYQQIEEYGLFTFAKRIFILLLVSCCGINVGLCQSLDTIYLKVGDIIPGQLISESGVSPIVFKTQGGIEMKFEVTEVRKVNKNGVYENVAGVKLTDGTSSETKDKDESQSNTLLDHQSPPLEARPPGRYFEYREERPPVNRGRGGKRGLQETFP
jgi:hypothetical protein